MVHQTPMQLAFILLPGAPALISENYLTAALMPSSNAVASAQYNISPLFTCSCADSAFGISTQEIQQ